MTHTAMKTICSDLAAEYQALDDLVAGLDPETWYRVTPFYGWTVFDQVAHIAFFDQEALLAVMDPVRFRERSRTIMKIVLARSHWPDHFNPMLGPVEPASLLVLWRDIRKRLLQALCRIDPAKKLVWYGPDMRTHRFAAARLMETWAHGQDIHDTLQKKRKPTDRLYHVAQLGVVTFRWSFQIRGLPAPRVRPHVVLTGPGQNIWAWGDPASLEKVRGSAEAFCLVVTQRRNVADTDLIWQGRYTDQWLSMAQAFAGIPQDPPLPGTRK